MIQVFFKFFMLTNVIWDLNASPIELYQHSFVDNQEIQKGLKALNIPILLGHNIPLSRFAAHHEKHFYTHIPLKPLIYIEKKKSYKENGNQRKELDSKQYEQISQQIEGIQSAIQSGAAMYGPQLSEAAAAAAAAASSAGSGFFPVLFPPQTSEKKINLKHFDGKQYEQISQQIEGIQSAIQSGAAMYGPQLSEAAAAAAAAASTAGSGFFPVLFPPQTSEKKLSFQKLNNNQYVYVGFTTKNGNKILKAAPTASELNQHQIIITFLPV